MESLQFDTPSGSVWKKIRSLKSGVYTDSMPIVVDNELIANPIETADLFVEHLQKTSQSGKHCSLDDFEEKLKEMSVKNEDDYNKDVTFNEVKYALSSSQDKSPGIDDIPNSLLRSLPDSVLIELVYLFNQSFNTGCIPEEWKTGVVIPILKSGKSKSDITSYRPIALLSCTGKLMEKIIQRRLI